MASASVHPLDTVFSASALIRALTRVSSRGLSQGVARPSWRADVDWSVVSLVRRASEAEFWGRGEGMANIAQTATTEALAGLVERVTFHNPENGLLRAAGQGARASVTWSPWSATRR